MEKLILLTIWLNIKLKHHSKEKQVKAKHSALARCQRLMPRSHTISDLR
jgi:hypothetical protein